jgi:hypothetical protein
MSGNPDTNVGIKSAPEVVAGCKQLTAMLFLQSMASDVPWALTEVDDDLVDA